MTIESLVNNINYDTIIRSIINNKHLKQLDKVFMLMSMQTILEDDSISNKPEIIDKFQNGLLTIKRKKKHEK